jgi:hypothetical protein
MEEANAAHEDFKGFARTALRHARRAGQALIDAKRAIRQALGPRRWQEYRDAHFHGKPSTARVYMQIAENWARIEPQLADDRDLTITQVRAFLSAKLERPDTRTRDLLAVLEAVKPGLAAKERFDQGTCFVFKDGHVHTLNEEVYCRCPLPPGIDLKGAVPARPLMGILGQLADEEINLTVSHDFLKLSGKGKLAEIWMADEIKLPIGEVKVPKAWRTLPKDFCEAIGVVEPCTGPDPQSRYAFVHLHPEFIEACDNQRLCRWRLRTGISRPTLLRGTSIRHIARLGMTDFAEADAWVLFRNPHGLVLACRRLLEEYLDLARVFDFEGKPLTWPHRLPQALARAQVFSIQQPEENNRLLVELRPGKMKVIGTGIIARFTESLTLRDYPGPAFRFTIKPRILADLSKRCSTCEIGSNRLRVKTDQYEYIAVLGRVGDDEPQEPDEPAVQPAARNGKAEPQGADGKAKVAAGK